MSVDFEEVQRGRRFSAGSNLSLRSAENEEDFFRNSAALSEDSQSERPVSRYFNAELDAELDNASFGSSFYAPGNEALRARRPDGPHRPRPITVSHHPSMLDGEIDAGGDQAIDDVPHNVELPQQMDAVPEAQPEPVGPDLEPVGGEGRRRPRSVQLPQRGEIPEPLPQQVEAPVQQPVAPPGQQQVEAPVQQQVEAPVQQQIPQAPKEREPEAPPRSAIWDQLFNEGLLLGDPQFQRREAELMGGAVGGRNRPASSRVNLIEEEDSASEAGGGLLQPAESQQREVKTDRQMVPFSNPQMVDTGFVSGTAAGLGKLGGIRGKGRQLKKNPLYMFPKRAALGLWGVAKAGFKLAKRGISAIGRGATRAWNWMRGRPGAAAPAAAQDAAGEEQVEAPAEQAPKEPTISVDPSTVYGKHMIAKERSRAQLADYQARNPGGELPQQVPRGWVDTEFGNANSALWRMRQGQQLGADEREYLLASQAKAVSIDKQRAAASPDNPSAFPFSQVTQKDEQDTGLAKTGHFMTATGGAINDREEVRPDEKTNPAGAAAWDALNIGTNAIKSGTKFADKQIKKYVGDDEKLLGTAGKAYLDTGKATQFTYGFVGKEAAKLYDNEAGGHAGSDLTKTLDPYLGIKNLDRVAQINAPIIEPGAPGSGDPGLFYSKNVNVGTLGKFAEHPATIMQAAGTGLTEATGKPFEKMRAKRAELLERQFVSTVARRKLQADRANRARLIDADVDPERRGKATFLNANAEMIRAAAGENIAAEKLGKQAQQEGYASNYGLEMNTTAMLNDKKHKRTYDKEFATTIQKRQEAQSALDDRAGLDGLLGTDDEDRAKRELAAQVLQRKWFRSKAFAPSIDARGLRKGKEAARQVEALAGRSMSDVQDAADAVQSTPEELAALSPLQWRDRKARDDGADQQQWRGLGNVPGKRFIRTKDDDENEPNGLLREPDEAGKADDAVMGRAVRRRSGAGRVAAWAGKGLGKGLSTVGGVLAFDGGEQDLKEGNLKTAAAKAAMSEVYQNGMTGGLGYLPVVGPYAKTVGLAALTPAGETLKAAGGALEEAAFGKENRDRQFNQHWGLEAPNAGASDKTERDRLRQGDRGQAAVVDSKKRAYGEAARELQQLGKNAPNSPEVEGARLKVATAREEVLDEVRKLRQYEADLGPSRRRELARTGLVNPARGEADHVIAQKPLSEEQLAEHRAKPGMADKLSASQPKELMVAAPKPKDKAAEPEPVQEQAADQVVQPAQQFGLDQVEVMKPTPATEPISEAVRLNNEQNSLWDDPRLMPRRQAQ